MHNLFLKSSQAALTFMIGKYHKVLNNKTKSVREILYDKTCEKKGQLIFYHIEYDVNLTVD